MKNFSPFLSLRNITASEGIRMRWTLVHFLQPALGSLKRFPLPTETETTAVK